MKDDRIEALRALLAEPSERGDQAREEALRCLLSLQTADERSEGETRYRNGAGFTGYDAAILTDIAAKRFRTEPMKKVLRSRLPKYARQLIGRLG